MRRVASRLAIFFVVCANAAACGGNVVHGSGGSGATGTGATGAGGTGPTGPVGPTSDCQTDADCPSPGHCVELTAGGYKVCTHVPDEATTCPGDPLDQCCTSADCKDGGKCYGDYDLPGCSGPVMAKYNECVKDQCASDADCTAGGADVPMICAPAGAFGYPARVCFTAYCHTNASCTAKPGGRCAPVSQPCCTSSAGLGCVYPGGCAKDADCGAGGTCQLDPASGTGVCNTDFGGCPL